jgi:hypothetical protein
LNANTFFLPKAKINLQLGQRPRLSRLFIDKRSFYFRNGGLGSVFKIQTINLEATTKEYQKEALDALTFVLKNAIPFNYVKLFV